LWELAEVVKEEKKKGGVAIRQKRSREVPANKRQQQIGKREAFCRGKKGKEKKRVKIGRNQDFKGNQTR